MKRAVSKRNLEKFSKINTHKRNAKAKAQKELLKIIEQTSVSASGTRIRLSEDNGRAARSSHSPHRDEITTIGEFSGARGGFGFLRNPAGERDIFIPKEKCGGAVDGDTVEVIYHEFRDRFGEVKTEGRVVKILSFGRTHIVGTLYKERRGYGKKATYVYIIEPTDAKVSIAPRVINPEYAEDGDKVLAKLMRRGGFTEAKIEKSFGAAGSFSADYESILAEFGIEKEFSPEALMEAKSVATKEVTTDGRVDFTNEIIFTIDGEGAKDLDDAISLKRLNDGWQLGVHIADVSEYVKEKTPLDRAAMSRGTSVYFTDKVVPMLPRELSNGACSLGANERKYTLSAIIKLSFDGDIISTELVPAVICSKVRGVYSEVNLIFADKADTSIMARYEAIIPSLHDMLQLYTKLEARAKRRGAVELDTGEAEIILDRDGTPTDIVRRERGIAERLIEQFMLTANEAVARLLTEKKIPLVYRVHEEPPEDKLNSLIAFLSRLGFNTRGIRRDGGVDSRELSKILVEAKGKGLSLPVSYTLLRSMAKAKYSEIPGEHFGLAIKTYCHFTSPIRRLSDLATHRIIKSVLIGGARPEAYASYAKRAAAAATDSELSAIGAERKIDELYKALYLSERIGEVYPAFVSSVTSFGIFFELENTCEGLVPLSDSDGFVFDEGNLSVRVHGKSYRLGDKSLVKVEECDVSACRVRFSIVEQE